MAPQTQRGVWASVRVPPTISFKLVRTLVEFPELAFLITGRSEKIVRPGG